MSAQKVTNLLCSSYSAILWGNGRGQCKKDYSCCCNSQKKTCGTRLGSRGRCAGREYSWVHQVAEISVAAPRADLWCIISLETLRILTGAVGGTVAKETGDVPILIHCCPDLTIVCAVLHCVIAELGGAGHLTMLLCSSLGLIFFHTLVALQVLAHWNFSRMGSQFEFSKTIACRVPIDTTLHYISMFQFFQLLKCYIFQLPSKRDMPCKSAPTYYNPFIPKSYQCSLIRNIAWYRI